METVVFFYVIGIVTTVQFGDALSTQPGVKGANISSPLSHSNDTALSAPNGQRQQPPKHPDIPTYDRVGQTSESMGVRVQPPPKPLYSLRPPPQTSRDRDGPVRGVPNERAKGRRVGGGAGEGGEEGGGRGGEWGGGGDWGGGMKPRPPIARQEIPDDETLAPYYMLFGRRLEDGLKKKGRKQQVLIESGFSLNLPPLAMAEYLLLTGDFTGFDEAMSDIVAIGMMSPWEAEIYRQEVGIEYQSLVKQETEAEIANLYSEYKEMSPSLEGEIFRSTGFSPFIAPPFAPAVQYPDSGYYGNQDADVIFDREPPSGVGAMNDGETFGLPPSEYIGELLQQMADVKDESNGPMDTDEIINTQSTPSTVSPEAQTVGQEGGGIGGKGGGKGGGRGGGEGKSGKVEGGKGGSGKGGKKKARAKVKGRKGGAAGEKEGRPSTSSLKDAADPEVVTSTQNKTKEANGTKTRRPLSKQPVISSVERPIKGDIIVH